MYADRINHTINIKSKSINNCYKIITNSSLCECKRKMDAIQIFLLQKKKERVHLGNS